MLRANCGLTPQVHIIRDPAQREWQPFVTIEHYQASAQMILQAAQQNARDIGAP